MRYESIEIKNHSRLKLNNVSRIVIEPLAPTQLIIGRNGSGKSSLLKELTPLPLLKESATNGGYKKLVITHGSSNYSLTNEYDGNKAYFSFIKDGEELANGFTATDYKKLIKKEFGITPEIQSLIDGVSKFSQADANQRRQWFTLLCSADFTYAFKYYQTLRSKLKDAQNQLIIVQRQLTTEKSKLLTSDEEQKLRDQINQHHQLIDLLRNEKQKKLLENNTINKSTNTQINIEQNINEEIKKINKYLEAIYNKYGFQVISNEDTENVEVITGRLNTITDTISIIENKLMTIKNNLTSMKDEGVVSADELHGRIKSLNEQIDKENKMIRVVVNVINPELCKTTLKEHYETLDSLSYQVEQLGLCRADIEQYHQTLNNKRIIEVELKETLYPKLTKIDAGIEYYHNLKSSHHKTCPNCNHQWIEGYDENKYEHLKNLRVKVVSIINEKEKLISDASENINKVDRYSKLNTEFRFLIASTNCLKPLWDYCQISEFSLLNEHKPILNIYRMFMDDINHYINIELFKAHITQLVELLNQLNNSMDKSFAEQELIYNNYNHELNLLYISKRNYKTLIENIKNRKVLEEQLNSSKNNLIKYEESFYQSYLKEQNCLFIQYLDDILHSVRNDLLKMENIISSVDVSHRMITSLESQEKNIKKTINLLEASENSLSPKTGLIAKGLTGFINYFLYRMNMFVKKVWSYPLEILPVTIDEDEYELKYKFPVQFDERYISPDVRPDTCNSSTCEIFDLAFRLIAYECLGFKDYPLKLDEFGSSFDHNHRVLSQQIIANLPTITNISQIFMVSHSEQNYTSLTNCDLIILDKNNIVLPNHLTKHKTALVE